MTTTPTPTEGTMTTTIPTGYNVLPFEAPRFAEQDAVNAEAGSRLAAGAHPASVAAAVAAVAARQLAEFPQYAGKFDGPEWVLVRCRRAVVTKGGLRFARGDYAVADASPEALPFCSVGAPTMSAYSVRGAVSVRVARGDFEVIG